MGTQVAYADMRTRLVGAALAVALGLTLAGCGDEPRAPKPLAKEKAPKSEPTAPDTTPPSAPKTTPPASDEGAPSEANLKAGAQAFVKMYVEVENKGISTGDLSETEGMYTTTCSSCVFTKKYLQDLKRKGRKLEGGAATGLVVKAISVGSSQTATVQASFRESPSKELDRSGKVIAGTEDKGGAFTIIYTVTRSNGGNWTITGGRSI